ncbi:unnamed protein product [Peronospora farinosa]|uniref:Copper transport protein n=1 Tax=Peronospora farinosa TaxID=134698 RepID=A0AAV0TV57_9STRA|nr:unnamed protein product [Peronospora farinosa]CAI5728107.1 unnamed protein product [Peronospora farinosa]
MEQNGFCIGPGSVMGTNGFKWVGSDPMDDCSVLWLESWRLTSFSRVVLACLVVFLLSVLYQYLTTAAGCQLQQSKVFAKRRLARTRTRETISSNGLPFYDPELSDRGRKPQNEESVVHPERPEVLDTKTTTRVTMERVYPISVKVDKWTHLVDAMMRGVRILLAYLLMLVVMTYDLTLITIIVVGSMTGFFVFGKDTAKVPVSADPCCS